MGLNYWFFLTVTLLMALSHSYIFLKCLLPVSFFNGFQLFLLQIFKSCLRFFTYFWWPFYYAFYFFIILKFDEISFSAVFIWLEIIVLFESRFFYSIKRSKEIIFIFYIVVISFDIWNIDNFFLYHFLCQILFKLNYKLIFR